MLFSVDMRARRWLCGLTWLSVHLGRVTLEFSARRRGHCLRRSLHMPSGSMPSMSLQPGEWSVVFPTLLIIWWSSMEIILTNTRY